MAQPLQPGEPPPPWNSGTIEYTEFDRNQMWLTVKRITTTCWFYLVVWTKGKYFILQKRKVTPNKSNHAEQIVLDLMERNLKANLPFFVDNPNAVLDVIFWMNNSPCKSCQTEIISKLQTSKTLLPATQFRFIFFFSSFYKKDDTFEKCRERLNEFFENLFTCDIIVIVGLLLVTRMVPKPDVEDVSKCLRREENNLDLFRKLCKERKDNKIIYRHDYTITASDDIDNENETKSLLQMKSFKTPHFSICRSDKLHLAQLIPKLGTENNNEEQEPEDCEMYSNEVQEGLGQEDEGISPTLLPK